VSPQGGGPIEGVRQRSLYLEQIGHSVEIVSLDDPSESFLQDFPLTVHALGPSRGGYGYNPRLVPWLRKYAPAFNAVIVNGLWEYNAFGAWRALHNSGVPYFVFTHGMLDPWFKRTYPLKHFKKWLYWPWATYRLLRDAQAVLFTTEEERVQARHSFWLYRAREHVVAYGTSAPPENATELRDMFVSANPELRDRRILLFLSRIHEKKGCDLLLHALASVAASDPKLHLVMAGPDQTGWVARLKALADSLGISDRVSWPGMLRNEMKWGAFYAAEAFVLPSHQENFGIAVAEALGCKLPVLISDKVNIWHEVRSYWAGLVAPDTLDGTVTLLRNWLALSATERKAMSDCAGKLYRERFTVSAMANSLLEVIDQYGRPVDTAVEV
jgi:glycosyltransferase involved in cell wall biosynthesis